MIATKTQIWFFVSDPAGREAKELRPLADTPLTFPPRMEADDQRVLRLLCFRGNPPSTSVMVGKRVPAKAEDLKCLHFTWGLGRT